MLVSVLFQIGKFGLTKTVITDGPCKDSRHGDNSVNEGSSITTILSEKNIITLSIKMLYTA